MDPFLTCMCSNGRSTGRSTVLTQWGAYVHFGMNICSGAYDNTVRCMCISALVIFLITVNSYEVFILTQESDICNGIIGKCDICGICQMHLFLAPI